MSATALSGGFSNAPVEAAHAFRAAMNVMARPGEIADLSRDDWTAVPPAPLSVAAGTLILTLCDPETGLFLAGPADNKAVRDWVTFHTGAPIVSAEQADFAVGDWVDLVPLDRFRIGTPEYPDRSATLIVEMAQLSATGTSLRGPGIREVSTLGLPDADAMRRNAQHYPLGLDFFLTSGARMAALPRSTQIGG